MACCQNCANKGVGAGDAGCGQCGSGTEPPLVGDAGMQLAALVEDGPGATTVFQPGGTPPGGYSPGQWPAGTTMEQAGLAGVPQTLGRQYGPTHAPGQQGPSYPLSPYPNIAAACAEIGQRYGWNSTQYRECAAQAFPGGFQRLSGPLGATPAAGATGATGMSTTTKVVIGVAAAAAVYVGYKMLYKKGRRR